MSQEADSSVPPEYHISRNPEQSALEKWLNAIQKSQTPFRNVLLTGRTGSGKSSLLNRLAGVQAAKVGAFEPTTKVIKEYKLSLHNINFRIFDTPGLGSVDEVEEEQFVKSINHILEYVDCMLYVTPLYESRVRADEVRAIRLLTETLGQQIWAKSILAFSFADKVHPDYYQDNLIQRTRVVKSAIERSVDSTIVKEIPAIGIDNTSHNTPDGKSWLTELCTTVILRSSVDRKALLASLQKLQVMHGDTQLSVSDCEESKEGNLVIRINKSFNENQKEVNRLLKHQHQHQLRVLEDRLVLQREHLDLYREQIEIERSRNNEILGVIKLMIEKGSSLRAGTISLEVKALAESQNNSEVFNTDLQGANVANFANKVADNARQQANQNIYVSGNKQTLAEAASEIQRLLKKLETSNPTATAIEKIAYVSDETTPSFKRRAVRALLAGSETAIEEFLDNSYINIGKAVIKAWIEPD